MTVQGKKCISSRAHTSYIEMKHLPKHLGGKVFLHVYYIFPTNLFSPVAIFQRKAQLRQKVILLVYTYILEVTSVLVCDKGNGKINALSTHK